MLSTRLVATALVVLAVLTLPCRGLQETYKCLEVGPVFPNCSCTSIFVGGVTTHELIIDCSNKGLTAVPRPVGTLRFSLEELRLNNNSITTLPASAFQNINVSSIDLRGNAISTVDNDAFLGLAGLVTLYLQGNGTNLPPQGAFPAIGATLESLTLVDYNTTGLHHDSTQGDPYAVFLALTSLKRLTIQKCRLIYIEQYAFQGPTGLQELSLVDNKMKSASQDSLRDLTSLVKLTISNTPTLEKLTTSMLYTLSSLQTLDLSDNSINTIYDNTFSGLAGLKTLRLSGNLLTDPNHIGSLTGMPRLQTLDLSRNDLGSVPNLEGLSTDQLLDLDLRSCGITSLQANAFTSVAGVLASIDLSNNQLSNINDDVFRETAQLKSVNLADQSRTSILRVPSTLGQVPLTNLDLSGQPLDTSALWAVIGNLDKLQVLDLSSTDLPSIPDFSFQGLSKLKELRLANNDLTELKQQALVGPRTTLKTLILSGSKMRTLSSCLLHQYQLPHSLQIALQPNSLECDCSLHWILDYVQKQKISFLDPKPLCPNGQPLLSKLGSLGCAPGTQTEQCPDYYQTPTTPAPTGRPQLSLSVDKFSSNRLKITWGITTTPELRGFIVKVTDTAFPDDVVFNDPQLGPTDRTVVTQSLPLDIFTVCVTPVYADSLKPTCQTYNLATGMVVIPQPQTDDDDGTNVGIIVGAVVAGVVLVAIILAILYLMFIRRKPKKVAQPEVGRHVQPRTYSKQELPEMAKDSMQVVAISDGITHNGASASSTQVKGANGSVSSDGPRVGRAHLLASEGSTYKAMSGMRPPSAGDSYSSYENDRGPLPKPPPERRGPQPTLAAKHGYYNEGFSSKYEDIEPREVSL